MPPPVSPLIAASPIRRSRLSVAVSRNLSAGGAVEVGCRQSGLAAGYLIQESVGADYVAAGMIPGLGSTLPPIFQDKVPADPAPPRN
jgi:hypothetical protein